MTTLDEVMGHQRAFALERDWGQFHTPKNLAMALGGEFGELAVAVADALSSPAVRVNLAALDSVTSEIADVALYLVRLFDVLDCPLPDGKELESVKRTPSEGGRPVFDSLARVAGSVGAILELWQWSDCTDSPRATVETELRLGAALRDLESLAELIGVDLANVASAKLVENADRYPVDKSFGSSAKYTQHSRGAHKNDNV